MLEKEVNYAIVLIQAIQSKKTDWFYNIIIKRRTK